APVITSLTAGSGDIHVDLQRNAEQTVTIGRVDASSTGDVDLALNAGTLSTTSLIDGRSVSLNVGGELLMQAASELQATGVASGTENGIVINAAGSITLPRASSAGGDVVINGGNHLVLGRLVTGSGDVTLTVNGNVTDANSVGSGLAESENIVSTSGAVAISASNIGSAAEDLDISAVSIPLLDARVGDVHANLRRAAGQTATVGTLSAVSGAATLSMDGGALVLNNATTLNDLGVSVNGSGTATGLGVGNLNVGGGATLIATGGAIVQSAGTTIVLDNAARTAVISAGNASATTYAITLDGAGNDFANVQLTGSNVTLTDIDGINLAASTVTGNLVLNAGGPVTDSGVLQVSGTARVVTTGADSAITLDSNNNFGGALSIDTLSNVTINDSNGVVFGASSIGGNLSLTAGGSVTDTGNVTVSGASLFTVGAGNDLTLDNTNNFGGGVTIASARNVLLNDTNSINIASATISGDLTLNAVGRISQATAMTVAGATTLSATLSTGSTSFGALDNNISLAQANDFGGTVRILAGGVVT
ncbi:MAG: hypothetical protein Q7U14_17055, partial [Lacisediminimonas sp.]|nr:hypothetical protein [Lacisediminimonas sp.]